MRAFFFYRGWMMYYEPVDCVFYARPKNTLEYFAFATLTEICAHVDRRTLSGRVGT